jgi:hypothetical protein
VIWQDAKFFRDDFVGKLPIDYEELIDHNACVTAMGLPVHKGTVGLTNIREGILRYGRYRPQYEHHCQAIIEALTDRPNVTDSSSNLFRQCDAYLRHVYLEEGNTQTMNQGLIDSAFIIWNQNSTKCLDFNNELRCTIMDQIQCHSDRDQVSIPFALYRMGLMGMYTQHPGEMQRAVDFNWDPRIHDLDFVMPKDKQELRGISTSRSEDAMVRVIRSSCHWYFSRLGDCRTGLSEDKPSIAIMVSGSAKNYMLTGLSDHVIKPLVQKQNINVDYYLMLSVKHGLAFRNEQAYFRLHTFDTEFKEIASEKDANVVAQYLSDKIRRDITQSGANIGGIHIQSVPMKLVAPELRKKQLDAKKERPKEDSYLRFPTLDLRPENRRRMSIENRNIFKLHLGIQKLWDKFLITAEHYMGASYDYVMMLPDDVLWLGDFNLKKLVATNPSADAYVLSCDLRDPPLASAEYADYGIVIKREKAGVIGRYFKQILQADACHKSVQGIVANQTGCNRGMLLYWILQHNNVTVQQVPQSLLPFERAMFLKLSPNETELCIHNYCQSKQSPLDIPERIRRCEDVPLPA